MYASLTSAWITDYHPNLAYLLAYLDFNEVPFPLPPLVPTVSTVPTCGSILKLFLCLHQTSYTTQLSIPLHNTVILFSRCVLLSNTLVCHLLSCHILSTSNLD